MFKETTGQRPRGFWFVSTTLTVILAPSGTLGTWEALLGPAGMISTKRSSNTDRLQTSPSRNRSLTLCISGDRAPHRQRFDDTALQRAKKTIARGDEPNLPAHSSVRDLYHLELITIRTQPFRELRSASIKMKSRIFKWNLAFDPTIRSGLRSIGTANEFWFDFH